MKKDKHLMISPEADRKLEDLQEIERQKKGKRPSKKSLVDKLLKVNL